METTTYEATGKEVPISATGPGLVRCISISIVLVALPSASHAYLDPGTGSIVLQSILASIAVALAVLRFHWQRFKALLSSLFAPPKKGNRSDQDPQRNSQQRLE